MISKVAASLALPEYKHLPGCNSRPDCSYLDSVAGQEMLLTSDSTAKENIAWHYGIRLFNHGYYWEAHEVLEAVWTNALPNSRERYLLQAVIHLANARLKVTMARYNAVSRLVSLARECIERAYPALANDVLMGVSGHQLECLLLAATQRVADVRIELTWC